MNSIRCQIMDKVIHALDGVTAMKSVSEVYLNYDDIPHKNIPACFPIDTNEEHDPFTLSGANDIHAILTISVLVVIHSEVGEFRRARCDMIKNINKAMLNDTALLDIILNISPKTVKTDQGSIEKYSLWEQEFEIEYTYARADGG